MWPGTGESRPRWASAQGGWEAAEDSRLGAQIAARPEPPSENAEGYGNQKGNGRQVKGNDGDAQPDSDRGKHEEASDKETQEARRLSYQARSRSNPGHKKENDSEKQQPSRAHGTPVRGRPL